MQGTADVAPTYAAAMSLTWRRRTCGPRPCCCGGDAHSGTAVREALHAPWCGAANARSRILSPVGSVQRHSVVKRTTPDRHSPPAPSVAGNPTQLAHRLLAAVSIAKSGRQCGCDGGEPLTERRVPPTPTETHRCARPGQARALWLCGRLDAGLCAAWHCPAGIPMRRSGIAARRMSRASVVVSWTSSGFFMHCAVVASAGRRTRAPG